MAKKLKKKQIKATKKAEKLAQKSNKDSLFTTHVETPTRGFRMMPDLKAPTISTEFRSQFVGMDDSSDGDQSTVKPVIGPNGYNSFPVAQFDWYSQQFFPGYQFLAILAQHWLIYKACSMPAKDALRKGWDITANDGTELDPKQLRTYRNIDKRMKINRHLREFVTKGRIFGIRIALFLVTSTDPEYYFKPFNIDGVGPGMYRGIVQIDPYWAVPELGTKNVSDPTEPRFYEPEYWKIGDKLIHHSHLVVFKNDDVADVLKPSYYYGGISIPQQIYERVYAAERTANEAPLLAMTKRLTVMKTDMAAAMSDPVTFQQRMEWFNEQRNNFGVKFNGLDDEMEQFDITLTDMDAIILTQYQLCAAIARVPGTKLLGTQPKGFNSTGEFEEASYHEELESLQNDDLSPFLDRHYQLVTRAFILPKHGIDPAIDVAWAELDAMTAQEQATVNAAKSAIGSALIADGTITPEEERNRLTADKDSGYSGLGPMPLELKLEDDQPPPAPGAQPGQEPGQGDPREAAAQNASKLPHPRQTLPKGA